jgi:hypothetical protein
MPTTLFANNGGDDPRTSEDDAILLPSEYDAVSERPKAIGSAFYLCSTRRIKLLQPRCIPPDPANAARNPIRRLHAIRLLSIPIEEQQPVLEQHMTVAFMKLVEHFHRAAARSVIVGPERIDPSVHMLKNAKQQINEHQKNDQILDPLPPFFHRHVHKFDHLSRRPIVITTYEQSDHIMSPAQHRYYIAVTDPMAKKPSTTAAKDMRSTRYAALRRFQLIQLSLDFSAQRQQMP